jgi:hypothetical protein
LRRGWLLGAFLHTMFNGILLSSGIVGIEWLAIPFVGIMVVMWQLAKRYYASAAQILADSEPQPKVLENA